MNLTIKDLLKIWDLVRGTTSGSPGVDMLRFKRLIEDGIEIEQIAVGIFDWDAPSNAKISQFVSSVDEWLIEDSLLARVRFAELLSGEAAPRALYDYIDELDVPDARLYRRRSQAKDALEAWINDKLTHADDYRTVLASVIASKRRRSSPGSRRNKTG